MILEMLVMMEDNVCWIVVIIEILIIIIEKSWNNVFRLILSLVTDIPTLFQEVGCGARMVMVRVLLRAGPLDPESLCPSWLMH